MEWVTPLGGSQVRKVLFDALYQVFFNNVTTYKHGEKKINRLPKMFNSTEENDSESRVKL